MVEAFIYMFFVGSGTTLGAASVGLLTFKVYKRMENKTAKRTRKGAF